MHTLATPIAQNIDPAKAQEELEATRKALLTGGADIIRAQRELNLTLREYNAAHGFASVSAHAARIPENRLKARNLDQDLRKVLAGKSASVSVSIVEKPKYSSPDKTIKAAKAAVELCESLSGDELAKQEERVKGLLKTIEQQNAEQLAKLNEAVASKSACSTKNAGSKSHGQASSPHPDKRREREKNARQMTVYDPVLAGKQKAGQQDAGRKSQGADRGYAKGGYAGNNHAGRYETGQNYRAARAAYVDEEMPPPGYRQARAAEPEGYDESDSEVERTRARRNPLGERLGERHLPGQDARHRLDRVYLSEMIESEGPPGPKCFGPRIMREEPPVRNFQLPRDTRTYDGTTKPEDWLADYVTAVYVAGGGVNRRWAAAFKELKNMLVTAPILASPLEREPMLLYIAATNRVVSVVVVVEREEEGKTVQRPVYYLSEVLSSSKQNYPHFQKMTYGVFMAATKLKHYFEEHPMKVVSEAPISDIMGNKDASGRIAKWAIQLSPYVPVYERRDAIKSQALADFLVDWAEVQYKPPEHRIEYWKMHFDGSKLKEGLGAGVVLTSPKGDHLRYVLQVHFRASNNVAEYEALIHGLKVAKEIGALRIICYGDSDLVVQQCSGDWDAKDVNMASYRFHVQKIAGFFEGCEFHHVPRAENEAADTLSKLGSSRQEIPPGIALAHLRVPSIKPSPESESIFVPESHVVPMEIDEGNPGTAPANSGTVPVNSGTTTPIPEEAMLVDNMDIDMPVFVVREAPSWVKPIKEFLINGTLPVDENESRRIQRRSKAYTIINGEAYKRSVTGVLQRCVEPEEGKEMLEEIHRGECGHHASSRALVAKVFRHGFYWPTALENAEDMEWKKGKADKSGEETKRPWNVALLRPFYS
ncbi:hypothetical protein QYE76_031626 [Lolium multiflorum]|uniref:RNase H type-1 domain-containing protein n=1 Tax=Lolium multiflorum TaxID=4521 RepID=A0AAD8VKL5_LOLMU|nr:hypothetical protein QYE76_031626 [Lolium multiflorum]